ncbi:FAD-dependent oxidoreductase [Gracilibacillus alcaliphilus]|uniref:FAD-dependent oxidoreductase n=1 Tax=Gracilibacillus alcaliphilus TaxID=1401441 RepID=UPI00195C0AB7|nr:FAD-dependent oxidoreductase [Gracilibacillus alcaliphilus]MBM7677563.1 flavin-dependent dehydrogenase [Gracilibacillus alcaliphilus]
MNMGNIPNEYQPNTVTIGKKELPILFDVDVVVAGGSFAGIAAAREYARCGKTVALIESRTYLGGEVSATLRPWLKQSAVPSPVPYTLKEIISRGKQKGEEIALYMDQVKTHLEDILLEYNIDLLYASYLTGVYTEESGDKLLIIGNKSGRQIIRAKLVVDATESASVLQLAGEQLEMPTQAKRSYWKTIEMYRTKGVTDGVIQVPKEIGVDNDCIYIHQGFQENGHLLLEFRLTIEGKEKDQRLDQKMHDEIASRHVMIHLAEYLLQAHPAFSNAYLAASSYELLAADYPRLSGDTEVVCHDVLDIGGQQLAFAYFATSDKRIWCLNQAARTPQVSQWLFDPVFACQLGEEITKCIVEQWDSLLKASVPVQSSLQDNEQTTAVHNWTIAEQAVPQQGKKYDMLSVPSQAIPVLYQTDVLVVGGGTSGAAAAIISAKEGMDTVLLEMNPGLGGTATLGAVDSYWFGRRIGFNQYLTQKVNEIERRLHHKSPKWNIEAKMYALLNEAEQAGVHTYFYTTTIGTIMDGNQVKGVIAASKWGIFAVTAETVIDATGDGDVAAFAGAEYLYGSERDHVVMWYSLAQFAKPGRSQNNFTSAVHISNILDYTRAILDGRRRKRNRDLHDHGIYVASRETRHILGDVVMTLTDQLRYRQWDDVINIHFSNHDMKGKSGADWMHIGLIPPNLEIEIPYRMVLPKGIEGLFIAGKAISATHDGFAAIRMQSDLENLGGIVALAAAQAVRHKQLPSEINVKELQQRIITEGMLPAEILDRKIENKEYQEEELASLVDSLTGDKPLYTYADMDMNDVYTERIAIVEVCMAGPRIIPYLEKAFDQATANHETRRQVILAQALAMYESSYGVPVLLEAIEQELTQSGNQLPVRDSDIAYTQLPPDHGAMPDVCYLLYSLGMTQDKRSIPVWQQIADKLDPSVEGLKDMFIGTFYYIDAICYGMERLADSACITILEKLHSYDMVSNQLRTGIGVEPDYFKERQAMLELSIVRALARCGHKKGYQVLIDYLQDARALLAEHAHTELKQITGKDFQKDKEEWTAYLEELGDNLPVKPVTLKLDR